MLWGRVRIAAELLLAVCTLWLIAQNLALLTIMPWKESPAFMVVVSAVVRAAWLVLREAWPVVVVALASACAVLAFLTGRMETEDSREVRHV